MNYSEEKIIKPKSGFFAILLELLLILLCIALLIASVFMMDDYDLVGLGVLCLVLSLLVLIASPVLLIGCKIVKPNEAIVLTLFGKYYGTISEPGFYFVNPFCSAMGPGKVMQKTEENTAPVVIGSTSTKRKINLKISTLNNGVQKVNDVLGNPLMLSAIVIWRVSNPTKAVLNVENYLDYLSNQTDSTIRNVARLYPYDNLDIKKKDELTLRGSAKEIAEVMQTELSQRVKEAGLEILDVQLNQISYAQEIAAAMLQRQQAVAIIAARQKIVEGAVGMVEMALAKLNEKDIVTLDEEHKAQMVSNLLVVLCGNKDAQPIVNSGSI